MCLCVCVSVCWVTIICAMKGSLSGCGFLTFIQLGWRWKLISYIPRTHYGQFGGVYQLWALCSLKRERISESSLERTLGLFGSRTQRSPWLPFATIKSKSECHGQWFNWKRYWVMWRDRPTVVHRMISFPPIFLWKNWIDFLDSLNLNRLRIECKFEQ